MLFSSLNFNVPGLKWTDFKENQDTEKKAAFTHRCVQCRDFCFPGSGAVRCAQVTLCVHSDDCFQINMSLNVSEDARTHKRPQCLEPLGNIGNPITVFSLGWTGLLGVVAGEGTGDSR